MIQELKHRPELPSEKISGKRYGQFNALIAELRKRNLPKSLSDSVNLIVAELNASSLDEKNFGKLVKKHQMDLLKILEKEAKLVTKNHYRNRWMLLGFTAIGIPIGILYGNLIGNMGMMSLGMPIGLGIGSLVGSSLDKKAAAENRQLDVEIKY